MQDHVDFVSHLVSHSLVLHILIIQYFCLLVFKSSPLLFYRPLFMGQKWKQRKFIGIHYVKDAGGLKSRLLGTTCEIVCNDSAQMDTIKDRNGVDLKEAQYIKKRWYVQCNVTGCLSHWADVILEFPELKYNLEPEEGTLGFLAFS